MNCTCNTTDWCECWSDVNGPCDNCRNRACKRHTKDERLNP